MNLKRGYNILGFGEIMMRLSTSNFETIETATSLNIGYGGAEYNVLSSLVRFGHNCTMLTKVPNNNIGKKVIKSLKANNVDTINILKGEQRLGKYFVENGQGYRQTNIIYDRVNSAFSNIKLGEIDFERVLKNIKLIHITGITPALNESIKKITLKILKEAKDRNILISYDSNYRKRLWSLEECGSFLREALSYVDIAFLNELDAKNFLNISSFAQDEDEKLSDIYEEISKKYRIKLIASIKRDIHSVDNNSIMGYIYTNKRLYKTKSYNVNIIDRIGGGDAYTAGILNAYLKEFCEQDIVEFGTIASLLKYSYVGDVNMCSENMVLDVMENNVGSINR